MKRIIAITSIFIALAAGALALGIVVGPLSADEAAHVSKDPAFYNSLGYQLVQQGKSVDAQAAFAKAVELDAHYQNALSNLATVAFQNQDYLTAIGALRVLTADYPTNANYHFDLGQNLASQARYVDADLGKLSEAAQEFDTADVLQPGFPHATDNAAIVRGVIADVS